MARSHATPFLRQQFRDVGHHADSVGEAKARVPRRPQTRPHGVAVNLLIDGRELGMEHQTNGVRPIGITWAAKWSPSKGVNVGLDLFRFALATIVI